MSRADDILQPRARPDQAWVCGHAQLGQACASGPTCAGRCGRASAANAVIAEATVSSDAAAGDAASCDTAANELPVCIPRRGERPLREALRVNLALITGGLLLLGLAGSWREAMFVPGELSSPHAQILNNTLVSDRCSACHPTAHHGETDNQAGQSWFAMAAMAATRKILENDGRQDKLCMQCHRSHMPAAAMRRAHDLSPEMWQQLQRDDQTRAWQQVSYRDATKRQDADATGGPSVVGQTSCAMCHVEHHGRSFDLKLISDTRCQACHRRQFESLASGHPEFTNFPPDRPRGLLFSHSRHAAEHFGKKNVPFDCKACHVDADGGGPYGTVTRSLSFEKACASCHQQPIQAAAIEGWALLQLPSIESSAAAPGSPLEHWPMAARFGFEGEISPVLRALLMADENIAPEIARLPRSGKLVDISTISHQRSHLIQSVALATERLMHETARQGQASWIRRLEAVTRERLGRELKDTEKLLIGQMCSGLPPDLFRIALQQWFTTTGHQARSQPTSVKLTATSALAISAPVPPTASDDDLLSETTANDSSSDLLGDLSADKSTGDELLLGTADRSDQEHRSDQGLGAAAASKVIIKGATHLPGGGWYLDEATLSIRYLPTGHADRLQAAWVQWFRLIESQETGLGDSLTAQIPGGCVQCHHVDAASGLWTNPKVDDSAKRVELWSGWRAPQRSRVVKEFTKFDHSPHLALPALSDCRYCHQLTESPARSEGSQAGAPKYISVQSSIQSTVRPSRTHSEFGRMVVQQCAACHRPGGANDGCLQCHNYHVQLEP